MFNNFSDMESVKRSIIEGRAISKPKKPDYKPPSSEKRSIEGSLKDGYARAVSAIDGHSRTGSRREKSVRSGYAREGSARNEAPKTVSAVDAPTRNGSAVHAPARNGSVVDAPARNGSAVDAPARNGSAVDAPARNGPAREDSSRYGSAKDSLQSRGKQNRSSLIPVAKTERNDSRGIHQKGRKSYSSSKLCSATLRVENLKQHLENRIRLLEEKEKTVERYYNKIEKMMKKLRKNDPKESAKLKCRISNDSFARKMLSDSMVFSKNMIESSVLSDLENNIQEISKIWQRASNDLSYTLKNFKSNPSLDPVEVEFEKVRIQLAIKQTKSLTLLKTRDIIAEAKKLLRYREMIRNKLESFIRDNNLIKELEGCECLRAEYLKKKSTSTSPEIEEKSKVGGTGDSHSDLDSQEFSCNETSSSEGERVETTGTEEDFTKVEGRPLGEDSSSEEKDKNSDMKRCTSSFRARSRSESSENWARDLARKNETITNLNNKIFDLQKTCNEHAHKYSQLQVVLSQFEEKIKWNQVLWKQIGKLKEQIKSLSHRNKNLESQKTDLETRILNLDRELERLFKLNHFLNQKKYLLESRPGKSLRADNVELKIEKCDKELECSVGIDEKVLAEKQSAINQLKAILDVMRDQENFAQHQISVFQGKIEELEKHTKI